MSKTNDELKDAGYNRAMRRIILQINKSNFGVVKQAMHHPIPSWRQNAAKNMRGF